MKEKICERAGKVADAVKRKGTLKITQVIGMSKKLSVVKAKVDRTIDKVESLEKVVGKCDVQKQKSSLAETPLPDCVMAEPQVEYSAELFD